MTTYTHAHHALGRHALPRGRHERRSDPRRSYVPRTMLWLRSRLGIIVGAAALALLSGAAGAVAVAVLRPESATSTGATASAGQAQSATTIEQAAAKAIPSVVKLETAVAGQVEEGSGVVLSADGLILTSNHVVATPGAGPASPAVITAATSADGRSAPFTIVGADAATDIAVVRVQGISGLKTITVGSSSGLHVGQRVVAIGSPLGLDGTVTTGVISALHRPVPSITGPGGSNAMFDAIQTDATMSPGSSGGALVDTAGALVGLNSAIATTGTAYPGAPTGWVGVGFAIPVDQAKRVADQLIAQSRVTNVSLGHN
ncbi:trypsin-like peptidase domain-containing protein [Mycobacterium sp.]|uniref:S1C family serine protease n=1 Tax=Mycobacterium sp. TaxID=1785 RepID=UPI0025DFB752|nr:trypsin-like peptidase domain-containing protein [Mycobacterium sp.]MBW0012643.1 trypsin-like peptidase domain-containing protein [Mycobacterium sp.]